MNDDNDDNERDDDDDDDNDDVAAVAMTESVSDFGQRNVSYIQQPNG